MRRLLWILLAVLTIVLIVLVMRQKDAALAELTHLDSASLETKITALVLLAMIALAIMRQRFSHVVEIDPDLAGDRDAAHPRLHLSFRAARRR